MTDSRRGRDAFRWAILALVSVSHVIGASAQYGIFRTPVFLLLTNKKTGVSVYVDPLNAGRRGGKWIGGIEGAPGANKRRKEVFMTESGAPPNDQRPPYAGRQLSGSKPCLTLRSRSR